MCTSVNMYKTDIINLYQRKFLLMLKLRRKDFSKMSWKVAVPFYYFTFTILALKWIEYKRKAYEWKKSHSGDELRLSISYNINQVSYPIKKKKKKKKWGMT